MTLSAILTPENRPRVWANILNVRMLAVLLLGFSAGIPLALTGSTLQAWMADQKIDLTLIGVFSLVGLPYTWKFAWSPLMDRFVPPFLGRRRGWILVSQILLVIAIFGMALTNPAADLKVLGVLAFMVAFFSASQDIVVDAYRTEIARPEELSMGASLYILGYRLAMLTSGALALILADHLPWSTVYMIMAGSMAIGVLTSIFSPEPPTVSQGAPTSLKAAIIDPLAEYFKRKGAVEILLFILLYKLGDVLTGALATPFLMELGFSKTDIGTVNKGFGLVSTILGAVMGGAIGLRLGLYRSLWVFGILQAVSNLMYVVLAKMGHHTATMITTIAIENLSAGMGTAAYSAFMMSLCDKRFTATQYALLTSLMASTRIYLQAPSGFLVKGLGWEMYYVFCTAAAVPGLLLLLRYHRWNRPGTETPVQGMD